MAFENIRPNPPRKSPLLEPNNLARVALVGSVFRYLRRRYNMPKDKATKTAFEMADLIDSAAVPGETP